MSPSAFPDDPGLEYLHQVLLKAHTKTGASFISVTDWEGDPIGVHTTETGGFIAAVSYAHEVDSPLFYVIGPASFKVIYDGPYTADNAAEIINDTNEAGDEIQQLVNQELGL